MWGCCFWCSVRAWDALLSDPTLLCFSSLLFDSWPRSDFDECVCFFSLICFEDHGHVSLSSRVFVASWKVIYFVVLLLFGLMWRRRIGSIPIPSLFVDYGLCSVVFCCVAPFWRRTAEIANDFFFSGKREKEFKRNSTFVWHRTLWNVSDFGVWVFPAGLSQAW